MGELPTPLPERLNIAERFLDARLAEGAGERVALRTDARDWSYREVHDLANRAANALRALGVRPEERVLVGLPDGPEYVAALFGILKLGAVAVMVNPALEPERLAALFAASRARGAVVGGEALAGFEAARSAAGSHAPLLVAGGDSDAHPGFEERCAGADPECATFDSHRDDPAIWLFSGGTTGQPKAVVQTHGSFANTTECYARRALAYSPDDITISVPKLYFGYATGSNLFFPFAVGASAVLFAERPTPTVLFEQIRRHRPTILVNVPTMINQMVEHPEAAGQDLSSLRLATSAGEALPAPLYHRWRETFGVELLDGLGTAEMWHIFLSNLPGAVKPGTLGRAVPGFEIEVRDDDGAPLPDGEIGRLWVRGDSRALGYWQDSARTARAFKGEWFVGGDLVCRDADGYVTYCGRADDVMKVSGKWLAPQEIEGCLMKHPAVAECAVVGVENEAGLTKPYAFVVRKDRGAAPPAEELETALQAWVLERLQPYKHPRRVLIVDDLPRTHLGKVDRNRLRGLAGA